MKTLHETFDIFLKFFFDGFVDVNCEEKYWHHEKDPQADIYNCRRCDRVGMIIDRLKKDGLWIGGRILPFQLNLNTMKYIQLIY